MDKKKARAERFGMVDTEVVTFELNKKAEARRKRFGLVSLHQEALYLQHLVFDTETDFKIVLDSTSTYYRENFFLKICYTSCFVFFLLFI